MSLSVYFFMRLTKVMPKVVLLFVKSFITLILSHWQNGTWIKWPSAKLTLTYFTGLMSLKGKEVNGTMSSFKLEFHAQPIFLVYGWINKVRKQWLDFFVAMDKFYKTFFVIFSLPESAAAARLEPSTLSWWDKCSTTTLPLLTWLFL